MRIGRATLETFPTKSGVCVQRRASVALRLFVDEPKDLSRKPNLEDSTQDDQNGASSPGLKKGFETHLQKTKGHVERPERIFQELGKIPQG